MPDRNIEKLLKEPQIEDFSDQTYKIRRNLIFAASFILVFEYFKIEIPEISFFGTKIKNLSGDDILSIALIFAAYFLAHFLWASFDHLIEWRMRLTGTSSKVIHKRSSFGDGSLDYPTDPKHSTLLQWFSEQEPRLKNIGEANSSLLKEAQKFSEYLAEFQKGSGDLSTIRTLRNNVSSSTSQINAINNNLQNIYEIINSQRIRLSLERYENWQRFLFTAHNIRFIMVDFGFPVSLAIWALYKAWC